MQETSGSHGYAGAGVNKKMRVDVGHMLMRSQWLQNSRIQNLDGFLFVCLFNHSLHQMVQLLLSSNLDLAQMAGWKSF